MRRFGLIGFPLSHSFSQRYFGDKFAREGLADNHRYDLFPLQRIEELPALIAAHPDLVGLNVTIPYKEAVLPYLQDLSPDAAAIGAVNTIRIEAGRLTGFNTDVHGFERGLRELLQQRPGLRPRKALILGTGGASKAVRWVLEQRDITYQLVSRSPRDGQLTYADLTDQTIGGYPLIINTTPLGMAPATDRAPELPYAALGAGHLLYDLIYNPEETEFLARGRRQGAATQNGLSMLYEQAIQAWKIWNRDHHEADR